MRIWYGLVGAVLGMVVGGAAAFLLVCAYWRGDDFGGAISLVIFCPAGMIVGCVLGVVTALRAFKQVHGQQDGGLPLKARRQRVLGLMLGAPILTVCMCWGGIIFSNPPFGGQPTDQQLLNNFSQHRATFEQLAQMAQTDKGLTRVDDDWTDPNNPAQVGVSPSRIREYRRLLRSVSVPRGFSASDNARQILFFNWLTGYAMSSDRDKGYAYLSTPPKTVISELDSYDDESNDKVQIVYRHIEGHWYLFYEYLPG